MHKHITSSSTHSMCTYDRFSRRQVGFNWVLFPFKTLQVCFYDRFKILSSYPVV